MKYAIQCPEFRETIEGLEHRDEDILETIKEREE